MYILFIFCSKIKKKKIFRAATKIIKIVSFEIVSFNIFFCCSFVKFFQPTCCCCVKKKKIQIVGCLLTVNNLKTGNDEHYKPFAFSKNGNYNYSWAIKEHQAIGKRYETERERERTSQRFKQFMNLFYEMERLHGWINFTIYLNQKEANLNL